MKKKIFNKKFYIYIQLIFFQKISTLIIYFLKFYIISNKNIYYLYQIINGNKRNCAINNNNNNNIKKYGFNIKMSLIILNIFVIH